MRELALHLPELVLTCERLGVSEPDRVAGGEDQQAFQWLESAAVRLHGFPERNRPGAIDVLRGGSVERCSSIWTSFHRGSRRA